MVKADVETQDSGKVLVLVTVPQKGTEMLRQGYSLATASCETQKGSK